jgi:prepilin-type N-terminal cleavage/methylation domain-containing protein
MEAKTEARRERGEGGFTLIELLIVVAILGVLVAVVLPNFTGLLGSSKTTANSAELVIVQTAVDAKMADQSLADYDPVVAVGTNVVAGLGLSDYMRSTTTNCDYTVDIEGTVAQVADSCD